MILRDITESRRTAQQTIESERLNALTLLAAGVAHEIGNPLNSLHIHLQLMERKAHELDDDAKAELQQSIDVARSEVRPARFHCHAVPARDPAVAAATPSGECEHDCRGSGALFHSRNSRPRHCGRTGTPLGPAFAPDSIVIR